MRELARGSVAALSEAARLLLLLLPPLVLALLGGAGHTVGSSVCDTAICGQGNCSERPGPFPPNLECHCDPGWSNALKLIPFSPCIVPDCSFNSACLNVSLTPPPLPAPGKLPDVCSFVNCGAGSTCNAGSDSPFSFTYSCECQVGYANLLNRTTLPCVNCFLGDECYALGLGAPPAPAPAPGPSGDHGPSVPPTPPSGPKGNATDGSLGSVSSPSLLHLLLILVSIVSMVQVV